MPQAVFRSSSLLVLALIGAGALSASPAGAQVYLYDGPYPPPPVRYAMLPPFEVRNIVRGMGYWQVARPQLSGRVYLVSAADEEGPVVLRVDAYTGRVLAARPVVAPPPAAVVPRGPLTPPERMARPAPPTPGMAGTPVPLPPRRPPEASLAMTIPAPAVPAPGVTPPASPAPIGATPASPVPAVPVAAPSSPVTSSPVTPSPVTPAASAAPPASPAGAPPAAPASAASVSPVAAPPSAPPAASAAADPAPAVSAPAPSAKHQPKPVAQKPQAPKAGVGAGTATPGGVAAGSASVLSRATVEKGAPQE